MKFRILTILLCLMVPSARTQEVARETSGTIEGKTSDPEGHPLSGVIVSLENTGTSQAASARSDSEGRYRFVAVAPGTYKLSARLAGWRDSMKGPVQVSANRVPVTVDFVLERDAAQSLQFSDEPTFTVAGVTDATNLGGHGSDVVLRTKEALAKETVSLGRTNLEEEKKRVAILRNGPDRAELHELLGDIAESEGRPLEAAREYQKAAETEPNEANLFAWGAELLLHRAWEPAAEIFAKGRQQFPSSTRMLLGLGVASYAQGHSDEAAQRLALACDLDPSDETPYIFLGKMQLAEKFEPKGWTERLRRFAQLHPQSALAHYYYAVALTKDSAGAEDLAKVEASLQKAIEIDPHLGEAYLQLGILYAGRRDFAKAIPAYQKAIENTELPDQAHFRLAEAYRLTGDRTKAEEEIKLYDQISKRKTQESERQRHEIQQFVYTLKGQTSAP